MNDNYQLREKHPVSGNSQGADIISKKETTDNHNNKQHFSQKQVHIGSFAKLKGRGFNVIPIIYGDKKAAIKWTQYQTKEVTYEQCKEWESERFNIGIVTGAISNIFVLDVDGEAGAITLATLEAQHDALPATLTASTGKGKHYYFAYPNEGSTIRNLAGQSVQAQVLQGLDVRGEGGYIVAPPSLHPNGKRYGWLHDLPPATAPDWLLKLVVQPPAKSLIADNNHIDNTVDKLSSNYLQTALDNELQELRNAPQGQRNNALNKAAYSLGQLVAHGLNEQTLASELLQVACAMGLDSSESMKTISSGLQSGMRTLRAISSSTKQQSLPKTPKAWRDKPVLFNEINTPDISARILPPVLWQYVEALALETETPIEMGIACALAIVSIATTGKYIVHIRDNWKEPLNLYWFVELPPANRKSAVLKSYTNTLISWEKNQAAVKKIEIAKAKSKIKSTQEIIHAKRKAMIRCKDETERNRVIEQIASMEAELEAIQLPVSPKLFSNNVTPESLEQEIYEQNGIFAVVSDEGGVMETLTGLYSKGKANIDILLKGIDGGEMRVKRKEREYNLSPFLSVLLVVQPKIREKMGENAAMQGNGALERFLYLIPKSTIGQRSHRTPPTPKDITLAFEQLISKLLQVPYPNKEDGESAIILSMQMEAAEALRSFQQWIEPQLKKGAAYYPLQGWAGKIAGFTARIAALIHLAGRVGNHTMITLQTVNDAITLSKGLLQHAKAAYVLMAVEESTRHAIHINEWIIVQKLKHFTRSELTTSMRHHCKKDQLDAAIGELAERNIVQSVEQAGRGTKPIICYYVNPALHE